MKINFKILIVLCCLLAVNSNAQNPAIGLGKGYNIVSNISKKLDFIQGNRAANIACPYDSLYSFNFDTTSQQWINDRRQYYTYFGPTVSRIVSFIDNGGVWEPDRKDSTVYDSFGNKLFFQREQWSGSSWIFEEQTKYTYYPNGSLFTKVSFPDSTVYYYKSNGADSLQFRYDYDFVNGWQLDYRLRFFYSNSPTLADSSIGEEWDGANFSEDEKNIYTYNANNQLSQWEIQYRQSGVWFSFNRWLFTYNAAGNWVTVGIEMNDNGTWVLINQQTYNYCANNCVDNFVVYDYNANQLAPYDSITTFCSLSTGVQELESARSYVSIYPNPASEFVNIEFADEVCNGTLELYSAMGQMVQRITGVCGKTIRLERNELPGGIYLMNLMNSETRVIARETLVFSDK